MRYDSPFSLTFPDLPDTIQATEYLTCTPYPSLLVSSTRGRRLGAATHP